MNVPAAPSRWPAQLGVVLGAFVVGTLVAELAGAANLGTAMTVGQIAFAISVVWVLLTG